MNPSTQQVQQQAEHRILQNYQQPMLTGYSVNSNANYPAIYDSVNSNANYPARYGQINQNRANAYDSYGDNSGGYYDYGMYNGMQYNDINRQGFYDDYNSLGYNNLNVVNSSPCSKKGISPLLILITIAGASVGFYFVYKKVKEASGNGRLKTHSLSENLDLIWNG